MGMVYSVGEDGSTVPLKKVRCRDEYRKGQLRLVFFLDEAPMELRSVVDFLNRQMEKTEVLLVEARQYTKDGLRVVVPTLFGYTEEARMVKRTVTVSRAAGRLWDADSFFDAGTALAGAQVMAGLRRFHDACLASGGEVYWGKGGQGTFMLRFSALCRNAILAVRRNGILNLKFGDLHGSPAAEEFRDRLMEAAKAKLGARGFAWPENPYWTEVSWEYWGPIAGEILDMVTSLLPGDSRADDGRR